MEKKSSKLKVMTTPLLTVLLVSPTIWAGSTKSSSSPSSRSSTSSKSNGTSNSTNRNRVSNQTSSVKKSETKMQRIISARVGKTNSVGKHISQLDNATTSPAKNDKLTERSEKISQFLSRSHVGASSNTSGFLDGPINLTVPINPLSPYYWIGLAIRDNRTQEIKEKNVLITSQVVDEMAFIDECLENAKKYSLPAKYCTDASWDLRLAIVTHRNQKVSESHGNTIELRTSDGISIIDGSEYAKSADVGENKLFFERSVDLRSLIAQLDSSSELLLSFQLGDSPKERFNLIDLLKGSLDIKFLQGQVVVRALIQKVMPDNVELNELLSHNTGHSVTNLRNCGRYLTRMGVSQEACLNTIEVKVKEGSEDLIDDLALYSHSAERRETDTNAPFRDVYYTKLTDKLGFSVKLSDFFSFALKKSLNTMTAFDSIVLREVFLLMPSKNICGFQFNYLMKPGQYICNHKKGSIAVTISRPKANPFEVAARKIILDSDSRWMLDYASVQKYVAQLSNSVQIEALEFLISSELSFEISDQDNKEESNTFLRLLKIENDRQMQRLVEIAKSNLEEGSSSYHISSEEWSEVLSKE